MSALRKFVKKSPKAPSSGDSSKETSKKRRVDRSTIETPAAAEVLPASPAVILSPPPPPILGTSDTPSAEIIALEPGELWNLGVSNGLRAAVRPPANLTNPEPLGTRLRLALAQIEESCFKAASLVPPLVALHTSHEQSASSIAALTLQVNQQTEKINKLESDMTAREGREKNLEERLTKAEEDVRTGTAELTRREERIRQLENVSRQLEERTQQLETDFEEARGALEAVAVEAWENAIAQLRVLNPNLETEGIDLMNMVRDGNIVPYEEAGNAPTSTSVGEDLGNVSTEVDPTVGDEVENVTRVAPLSPAA